MLISHNREKLLNSIVYFAKNTRYLGITKLMKLLYFLDFTHFKQTGKSVTGLDYYAWKKGPVPSRLWREIINIDKHDDLKRTISLSGDKEEFQEIKAKEKFNPEYFSKRELKLLKDIALIFKDARAEHIVKVAHLPNDPWDRTIKNMGKDAMIDYMLALDNKDSLSREVVLERLSEMREMEKIFSHEKR